MATVLTLDEILHALDTARDGFTGHRHVTGPEIDAMSATLTSAHDQLGGRPRQRCAVLFRALTHEPPNPTAIAVAVLDLRDELTRLRPPHPPSRPGQQHLFTPAPEPAR